jgi:signal peptidase I
MSADKKTTTTPPEDPSEAARGAMRENLESILVAVLFALFVRGFIAQPYKIPSGSMEENLLVGDHLVVNKVAYGAGTDSDGPWFLPTQRVQRGDVVIFRPPHAPETDYIKRVIGLPGETVTVTRNAQRNGVRVFIDGEALPEDFRTEAGSEPTPEEGAEWVVNSTGRPIEQGAGWSSRSFPLGEDEFFMMGDNRNDSLDSRAWGEAYAVDGERIRGRAWFIYWSYDGDQPEPPPGLVGRIGYYGKIALGFVTRTRWSRSFNPIR